MFFNCYKLEELDLSGFDTRKVTNLGQMFTDCHAIKELDLSSFETPAATSIYNMFGSCYELESLDISSFDTSNIVDMSSLFSNCRKLKSLDIRSFNTYRVTTMTSMFNGCNQLEQVDLSNFYTANVRSMNNMFMYCYALTSLDLSSFDTSSVTNMQYMFYQATALEAIYVSNYWNTDSVTQSYRMFYDNPRLHGGLGTAYSGSYTDKTRAVIDSDETRGYLTHKTAGINNSSELVSTNEDSCVIVKVSDSVWVYTFTGLNPNVHYYAWEEEIEDYIASNLQDSPLEVRDLKGTITNRLVDYPEVEPEYGSLSIKKVLAAERGAELTESDLERTFLFTVTLTDENGEALSGTSLFGGVAFSNGVGRIRIPGGMTCMLDYIPSGYHYTVTEEDTETFSKSGWNDTGVIETDITSRVIYTNTKSSVPEVFNSFTLRKLVTGIYENELDYLFTVYLEGLHAEEEYTLSDGSSFTSNSRGTATVDLTLGNGDEITFSELPAGSSYKITEAGGDYVSSFFITDAQDTGNIIQPTGANSTASLSLSTATEFVEADEEITVVFTNTRNARQNLRLVKRLENAADNNFDTFAFTAEFAGLASGEIIRTSLGLRTADENGSLVTDFEMASDEELVFYKLPVGSTYRITEGSNEWIASYELVNSGTGGSAVKESDANEENFTALSTAEETVNENEEMTVFFTNTKVQRDLTVTKMVDMSGGELPFAEYSRTGFTLVISLSGLDGLTEYDMQYTMLNYAGIEAEDSFTSASDGTAELVLELKHGQSVKLKDLPVEAKYTVTEAPAINYISSYRIRGNEGAVIASAGGSNRKTFRSLSTAEETVDESELDVEVTFTNRYYDDPTARIYAVRLEKEIDTAVEAFGTPTFLFRLKNLDTGDDFLCSIVLENESLSGSTELLVTKGRYIAEELSVDRYSPESAEFLSGTTATELRINDESVEVGEAKQGGSSLEFKLGITGGVPDSAYMKFNNRLTNYFGVSHNSIAINHVA